MTASPEEEVKKHLRRTGPGTFELVEPHLLYLDHGQAVAYINNVRGDENYSKNGFHGDLLEIMRLSAGEILKHKECCPDRLELIDLGPGYPDITLLMLEAADNLGMRMTYIPYDISYNYVMIAGRAVKQRFENAEVQAKNSQRIRFEDIDANTLLMKGVFAPYIYLGLTYMNFPSDEVGSMLKKMSSTDSTVFIASEILNADNTSEMAAHRYSDPQIKKFVFGPLEHLGYGIDAFDCDLGFNQEKKRVEFVFTYKKTGMSDPGLFEEGDKITTFVSYRYTPEELEAGLAPFFSRREMFVAPSGNTAMVACRL